MEQAGQVLKDARPTAVNLAWAMDRALKLVRSPHYETILALQAALLAEADEIAAEVVQIGVERLALQGAGVFNPAFDVTPAEYNTGIITEAGIAYPPYTESPPRMASQARKLHEAERRRG